MLKKLHTFIFILCMSLMGASLSYGQRQVGIPFEKKAAILLEFAAPYETMRVSFKERDLSTNIYSEARLSDDVALKNKKGKPADPSSFLPGMEVLIDGEKTRSGFTFLEVRLQTTLKNWHVKLNGIYEKFEAPVAIIDGRRVVLAKGATIKGAGPWKKKSFKSFDYMQLGSFVEIEGSRDADGLIQARKVKTWPNLFTKEDKAIKAAINSGLQPPQNLSGGRMKIGGTNFWLTRKLDLQAYVTELGYNLIPQWTEELPDDDPARVDYRFYVVNDPSFNASAFPDGTVIVHTGLLQAVANEAQLAAVLAHEIAHVTHEHGLQRFREQKKVKKAKKGGGLFKKAFTKVTGKDIRTGDIEIEGFRIPVGLVAKLGEGALSNTYSRKRESQADRVGLFYMVEAGYDPREAATMWTLLAEKTANPEAGLKEKALGKIASIYASHPEAVKRARNINIEIAANYSSMDLSQLKVGTDAYQQVIHGYQGLPTSRDSKYSVSKSPISSIPLDNPNKVSKSINDKKRHSDNDIQHSDVDTSRNFIRARLDGKIWKGTTEKVEYEVMDEYKSKDDHLAIIQITGASSESFGYRTLGESTIKVKLNFFLFRIFFPLKSEPGNTSLEKPMTNLQGQYSFVPQDSLPITLDFSNGNFTASYAKAAHGFYSDGKKMHHFSSGHVVLSVAPDARLTGRFEGVITDDKGKSLKVTEGWFETDLEF